MTKKKYIRNNFIVASQHFLETIAYSVRKERENRFVLSGHISKPKHRNQFILSIFETKNWSRKYQKKKKKEFRLYVIKSFQSLSNNRNHFLIGIHAIISNGMKRLPTKSFSSVPCIRLRKINSNNHLIEQKISHRYWINWNAMVFLQFEDSKPAFRSASWTSSKVL